MKPLEIIAALLLTAEVAAPVSPDEALKIRALRLGYSLNGEQMVRNPTLGSIDVSGLIYVPEVSLIQPPSIPTENTPPPSPPPPAPRPQ